MSSHFGEMLGLKLVQRADGEAVYKLEVRPDHCNVHGSVHGGVVMAILDTAGLWAYPPDGDQVQRAPRAATAAFTCSFLRAATAQKSKSLRATAQLVKRGRATYFASVQLHSEPEEELIATGQGVYTLLPPV